MKSRRKRTRREVLDGKRMLDVANEASVVLDAILEGRAATFGADGFGIRAECRRLMKLALKLHQDAFPRRWTPPARRLGWTGRIGLYLSYADAEHHYMCGFCGDNIETRPNGKGGKIMSATINRFEAHGWTCGMQYLMERAGLGRPVSP